LAFLQLVAAGFSLRLFAQLKSCGYRNLFAQVKTYDYPSLAQPEGCGYHLFILGGGFNFPFA